MRLETYPPEGYPEEGWPLPKRVGLRENLKISQSPELHADVLYPKTQQRPLPAVVWLHGGGWRWGNRRGAMERLFALAASDYVCIAVDYRLTDRAIFPAQTDDVKTALRWIQKEAQNLGVDPSRIAIFGGSAGGHLGLLAALDGNLEIAAVVAAFPPTNLLTLEEFPDNVTSIMEHSSADSCEGRLLGEAVIENTHKAQHASPIHHVRADAPSILLIHGAMDAIVSVYQSRDFNQALSDIGGDITYWEFQDGGHSAEHFPSDWMDRVHDWLNQKLNDGGPRPSQSAEG